MNIVTLEIIIIGIVCLVVIVNVFSSSGMKSKKGNISEWSYQRYAKFYDNIVLPDEEFNKKLGIIYDLVVNKKETDLNKIAKLSSCTFTECILKIKYLKNKRRIGDLYIDEINGVINKCSPNDKLLLDKYRKYIYYNHYNLDEIVNNIPRTTAENMQKIEEKVFSDLMYLDSKGLLNGIIIDEVDRKIIYYSVEKHKKEKDFVTINCPNCGAINDVNRNGKARCDYCRSIVEDK